MQIEAVAVMATAVAFLGVACLIGRKIHGPIPPSPAKEFEKYPSAEAYVAAKAAEYRAELEQAA